MEIRVTGTFQVKPSTSGAAVAAGAIANSISATGSNYIAAEVNVGTTYTALPSGSCSNIGSFFLQNNSTASIDISIATTSQSFTQVPADKSIVLLGSSSLATYFVRSSMSDSPIQYIMSEK